MGRKKKGIKRFLVGIVVFILAFAVVFLGIQYFTKTGLFRIPGVVYYDESLSEEEKALLDTIFTEEVDLDKDVFISVEDSLTLSELEAGEFLYDILVPVTDFYDTNNNINVEDASELFVDCVQDCGFNLINIDKLDFTRKLLSLNNKYYLDEFDSGAVFHIMKFESEKYAEEIEPLVAEKLAKVFPEKESVLTFAQTGVTALSRGMNAKLYSVGDANYFAERIGDYLSSFDITHTSNESSFSDYANSRNICSDNSFIDTLLAIGLDVVELTGNHNQDCGDESALNTIDKYVELGIKMVGGGKTLEDAIKPLDISQKDTNITFLAYNLSTGGVTWDGTPGANPYDEERVASDISLAKQKGNFILVDIQYYECSDYDHSYEYTACDYANSAAGDQVGLFRHLIDLGADMVVGTSAHQTQTFELYGKGVIYYGLGNLFFDQIWWPGTTRSLILSHYFYNNKLLQTKLVPTVYDASMQTTLLDPETSEWFINRLIEARP